jgi:hypothetical protein
MEARGAPLIDPCRRMSKRGLQMWGQGDLYAQALIVS